MTSGFILSKNLFVYNLSTKRVGCSCCHQVSYSTKLEFRNTSNSFLGVHIYNKFPRYQRDTSLFLLNVNIYGPKDVTVAVERKDENKKKQKPAKDTPQSLTQVTPSKRHKNQKTKPKKQLKKKAKDADDSPEGGSIRGNGSTRVGIGINDIPVDLGEVISDPLLSEEGDDTQEDNSLDNDNWRHAVECAMEEIHSQVKYSENQFSWMKPFRNKSKTIPVCERCEGTGMMICEYCRGQGFVRFGPGNNFRIRYRQMEVVLPRRVWGDLYYCPACGGLRKERCITCYGSGSEKVDETIETTEQKLEHLALDNQSNKRHKSYLLRDINKEIEEKLSQLGIEEETKERKHVDFWENISMP
eukprot:jgi/Galph1/5027/GphlegSOOS_G3634.1